MYYLEGQILKLRDKVVLRSSHTACGAVLSDDIQLDSKGFRSTNKLKSDFPSSLRTKGTTEAQCHWKRPVTFALDLYSSVGLGVLCLHGEVERRQTA